MMLRRRLEKEDYQDKPFCGYCNLVDVDLYETLRQYFEEIQDARNRGYGWGQIRAALRDELTDDERWRPEWAEIDLAEYFSLLEKNTNGRATTRSRRRRR